MLPPLLPLGFGSMLYLFLTYIICMGCWQFYLIRSGKEFRIKSLVPLGAAAVVVSFIAFVQHYRMVFKSIEQQGDISPAIVAAGFKEAFDYPTLGLLCLAIAFIFKYVNSR
jgi:hypothetical protein